MDGHRGGCPLYGYLKLTEEEISSVDFKAAEEAAEKLLKADRKTFGRMIFEDLKEYFGSGKIAGKLLHAAGPGRAKDTIEYCRNEIDNLISTGIQKKEQIRCILKGGMQRALEGGSGSMYSFDVILEGYGLRPCVLWAGSCRAYRRILEGAIVIIDHVIDNHKGLQSALETD